MSIIKTTINGIDWFIDKSGQIFKWLTYIFTITIAYDVAMRYIFNMPTVWSYEISYMLSGSMVILGGAFLVLHGGHVKIEVIYGRLSSRQQLILDVVLTLLLFFPIVAILTKFSFDYACKAWILNETSQHTYWAPPLFPFRVVVFLGFCLLSIEGISWFIRKLVHLVEGKET